MSGYRRITASLKSTKTELPFVESEDHSLFGRSTQNSSMPWWVEKILWLNLDLEFFRDSHPSIVQLWSACPLGVLTLCTSILIGKRWEIWPWDATTAHWFALIGSIVWFILWLSRKGADTNRAHLSFRSASFLSRQTDWKIPRFSRVDFSYWAWSRATFTDCSHLFDFLLCTTGWEANH